MKFNRTDHGNQRIYYTVKNRHGEKLLYCFMEDRFEGIELYRASMDGEPSHPVKVKTYADFELPPQTCKLSTKIHNYLKEQQK